MSRACDYFLASAEHEGASLFPSGLLMYDLPSSRRRTSQRSDPIDSSRKRSSCENLPMKRHSSSSSSSSIVDEENSTPDESIRTKHLTTSEDWWKQAIEPVTTRKSHLPLSMFDDDDDEEENRSNSSQRFYVHNRPLITLNEIYSDKVIAHVKRWYERHSLPQLNLLIKRGLLKTFKDKSIRMSLGTKKKEIYGQLDQNGKILSSFDNQQFDSIEHFYRNYQSRRKQNDSLAEIYQNVRWYDQSFHSILLEYAENLIKTSTFQTRSIQNDELFDENTTITKEILCQIDCWTDGRNEIDL